MRLENKQQLGNHLTLFSKETMDALLTYENSVDDGRPSLAAMSDFVIDALAECYFVYLYGRVPTEGELKKH